MRASGYVRATNDWYVEDRRCVDDFLNVETFTGLSWDPSCGGGNIPKAMNARGLSCMGTDICERGYGHQRDFLAVTTDRRVDNIICNPPYGVIEPWIEKALSLATSKVAVLARLAFLEGVGRRDGLFRTAPLARVWVSSRRVSMPPGGSDIKAKGGTIAYGWFVFEHGHVGPWAGGWI